MGNVRRAIQICFRSKYSSTKGRRGKKKKRGVVFPLNHVGGKGGEGGFKQSLLGHQRGKKEGGGNYNILLPCRREESKGGDVRLSLCQSGGKGREGTS